MTLAKKLGIAVFRGAFAVVAFAAIAGQYSQSAAATHLNPVNFFSYFTIDSNVLAAIAFFGGAAYAARDRPLPAWLDFARGATVVYMATTGIVYALMLRGTTTQADFFLKWADDVLHILFPLAVVADWMAFRPCTAISGKGAMGWLAFPGVWIAYTLIRGAMTRWYPYPFLAPNPGYGSVAGYCAGIAVFMGLLCAAVRAVGNMRGVRRLT